jgi:hypothetical protein
LDVIYAFVLLNNFIFDYIKERFNIVVSFIFGVLFINLSNITQSECKKFNVFVIKIFLRVFTLIEADRRQIRSTCDKNLFCVIVVFNLHIIFVDITA